MQERYRRPEGRGAVGMEEIEEAARGITMEDCLEGARRVAEKEAEEIRGSGVGLHGMQISLPESLSVLRIGPSQADWHGKKTEVMRIESPYPYPGPLRRLAYWLVLGWKWERP